MNSFPEHKTLAEQVADALKRHLDTGRWSQSLPGYRILAEELGVSWRTSRDALVILEERGLIEPASRGKPRRIRLGPHGTTEKKTSLLVVTSSLSPLDADELELLDQIRLAWATAGGHDSLVRVNYQHSRNAGSKLEKLVEKHGAQVLVMQEPSEAWAHAAMTLRRPTFFLGCDLSPDEYHRVSGAGYSVRQAIADTSRRLYELGHRSILIPDHGRGKEYRKAIFKGVRQGFGEQVTDFSSEQVCPEFSDAYPAAWQRYWEESFRRVRPTAVVVMEEFSYLSLLGFAQKKGMHIPRDLSVVCLSSSEYLDWCSPPPNHFRFPNARAVSLFRRWIRTSFPVVGMRLFPVEFIERGSVCPVRAKVSR